MPRARCLLARLVIAFLWACSAGAVTAAPPPTVTIRLPAMNVPGGGAAVVSDALLVYTLPDPPLHALEGAAPFLDFHTRVYVLALQGTASRVVTTQPHLAFVSPRGVLVAPWSVRNGWLVYTLYPAADPAGVWLLVARHVATGEVVVLDTSVREGTPSLAAQAASDGRTVVWQSWTMEQGQVTSVIRAYDLRTGQRRLLAEGGSPSTWSYAWPGVSGNTMVFEREQIAGPSPSAQILALALDTGRARALTTVGEIGSEPAISGNLVVWKQGRRYEDGHGIALYDLRTGTHRGIAAPHVEQPRVTAGRYVVFPTGGANHVQLYDAQTGTQETLAAPLPDGYLPGNDVRAGEHMVVSTFAKLEATTTPSPTRLTVTMLP